MAGSATLTAVESTAAMEDASIAVMRASCLVRAPALSAISAGRR